MGEHHNRRRRNELGRNLRQVRQGQGKTLRDIEKRSKLNNGYLSQVERGDVTHPSPTVLRKLAKGYEVPFAVVLRWAGYVEDDEFSLTANQAVALSTLGDLSTEELEALKGIVAMLRAQQRATYGTTRPSEEDLDQYTLAEISGLSVALLREADAIGKRPTPLEDIRRAADLVSAGEISLSVEDRRSLAKRFGGWVERAWSRLLGSIDFREDSVWVKPGLHPSRKRFVLSHEIGHAILPAHRETFAHIDDFSRLDPEVAALYEREANQAAVEILFQGDALREEADSSSMSLDRICALSASFGGSIVATARRLGERSRQEIAIAMIHHPNGYLGPTHLYTSPTFERRFRWRGGLAPQALREAVVQARSSVTLISAACVDTSGRGNFMRVETLSTGYSSLALIVRERRLRASDRLESLNVAIGAAAQPGETLGADIPF